MFYPNPNYEKKVKKIYTPGSGKGLSPGRTKQKKMHGRPAHYRMCYNENNLQQAVNEVKEHRMSLGEAAQEFQVSKTTGRPTVLSEMEEKYLIKWLIVLGDCGLTVSRKDLRTLMKDYLDGLGMTTRKKHFQYYNVTPT